MKARIFFLILSLVLIASSAHAATGVINPSALNQAEVCHDPTCTSPTPGIINFELESEPSIVIDSITGISGKVWGNELGWINMNPTGGGVIFADATTGLLTGKAFSQVSGWINFAPTGQSVTIDPCTGEFDGYAWSGGAYGGWIKFDCSDASTCVRTTWRSGISCDTGGGGSGGGSSGGSIPPTPSPSNPVPTPETLPPSTPPASNGGTVTLNDGHSFIPPPPQGASQTTTDGNRAQGTQAGNNYPPSSTVGTDLLSSVVTFLKNLKNIAGRNLSLLTSLVILSSIPPIVASLFPLIPAAATGFNQFNDFVLLGIDPKKKIHQWGTIYDSATKRPIPYARVQLVGKDLRVRETKFTNSNGAYGFLTTPKLPEEEFIEIKLQAQKDGYTFPSIRQILNDKLLYDNIYYGDIVKIFADQTANFDVPMDPIDAKTPKKFALGFISPLLSNFSIKILTTLFWLSLIVNFLLVIFTPNILHMIGFIILACVGVARAFEFKPKPFGTVLDRYTGAGLPYVLIAAYDRSDRKMGFTVSDELGRYILLAEQNVNKLRLYTPVNIVPPRSAEINTPDQKGYIIQKVRV